MWVSKQDNTQKRPWENSNPKAASSWTRRSRGLCVCVSSTALDWRVLRERRQEARCCLESRSLCLSLRQLCDRAATKEGAVLPGGQHVLGLWILPGWEQLPPGQQSCIVLSSSLPKPHKSSANANTDFLSKSSKGFGRSRNHEKYFFFLPSLFSYVEVWLSPFLGLGVMALI